jgi:hypothetical protein
LGRFAQALEELVPLACEVLADTGAGDDAKRAAMFIVGLAREASRLARRGATARAHQEGREV